MARLLVASGMCALLAGCSKEQPSPPPVFVPTAQAAAPAPTPTPTPSPNYAEEDNGVYYYIAAVTPKQKEEGQATGQVIGFRYRGINDDGLHGLESMSDDGKQVMARAYCASPCKIIRYQDGSRTAFNPESIIGSAFEDALAGRLKAAFLDRPRGKETAGADLIPTPFTGEWNTDLAACGTGLNDSRLRITASEMHFYESTGKVTKVKSEGPRVISVTASFAGEGERWTNTEKMTLSPSGAELTIDGFARQRCRD
jgi:hypothetical protein